MTEHMEDAKTLVPRELRRMMPKLTWAWEKNQVGIKIDNIFTRATLRAEDWLDIIDAAYKQGREDEMTIEPNTTPHIYD